MSEFKPGDEVGGCKIDREIAKGGMGTVYRARQIALDRIVAVKVLKPELTSYPDILKRFLREGKLAAKLDHPGIIHIYDIGQEGNNYFLVMEFVEGQDLCQLIEEKGPLPPRQALDISRKVANALSYAHERGIVHRDIKPQNIILSPDNTVKIADFGIARVMEQETMLTSSGMIIGTPAYMSPEQCRGEAIDGRSDLYNLGATIYTLLCGRVPFSNPNCAALVHQVLNDYPPPLDNLVQGLSPAITALVKRLMAKHPAARFQTGMELIATIDEIQKKRCVITGASAVGEHGGSRFPLYIKSFCFLFCFVLAISAGLYFIWPHLKESFSEPGAPEAHAGAAPSKKPKPGDPGWNDVDLAALEEEMADDGNGADRRGDDGDGVQIESALEDRINSFRDFLMAGQTKEILDFIDPDVRDNPSLLLSLGSVLKKLQTLGSPLIGRFRVESADEDRTKIGFFFKKKGSQHVFRVNLFWTRHDGIWYIKPETLAPSESHQKEPASESSKQPQETEE